MKTKQQNKYLNWLKENLSKPAKIALNLATFLLIFYAFSFLGWKGIIGLIAGMTMSTYLILSKNPLLEFMLGYLKGGK